MMSAANDVSMTLAFLPWSFIITFGITIVATWGLSMYQRTTRTWWPLLCQAGSAGYARDVFVSGSCISAALIALLVAIEHLRVQYSAHTLPTGTIVLNLFALAFGASSAACLVGMAIVNIARDADLHNRWAMSFTVSGIGYQFLFAGLSSCLGRPTSLVAWRFSTGVITLLASLAMIPLVRLDARYGIMAGGIGGYGSGFQQGSNSGGGGGGGGGGGFGAEHEPLARPASSARWEQKWMPWLVWAWGALQYVCLICILVFFGSYVHEAGEYTIVMPSAKVN